MPFSRKKCTWQKVQDQITISLPVSIIVATMLELFAGFSEQLEAVRLLAL
jgi:hypothetical protein